MAIPNWISQKAIPLIRSALPVAILSLIAFGLRIYRLSDQPLWLDEIYSIELAREGPLAILRNSLSDPHPPLFYFLQWLASGFGAAHSEWGWRWLSLVCGGLSVPLFYALCLHFSGRLTAAIAALTLAVSPFHIYYSQEGRSYAFLTMLAILTMLIMVKILAQPARLQLWIILAILSLIGLFSSYSYLLILGVQGLILVCFAQHRFRWLYVIVISLGVGIASILILPTITATARQHLNTSSLTLLITLQSMAGEPVHFRTGWQHAWLVTILGGSAFLGLISMLWTVKRKPLVLYLGVQILLPLLILSILRIYPGIRLPYYESRQFLILVPAFLGVAAIGLDTIKRGLGWGILIFISAAILIASAASIQAYWNSGKSPEGSLVKSLHTELGPGEAIISLHYSLTAAIYAYPPANEVWVYHGTQMGEYQFDRELRLPQIAKLNPISVPEGTLEEMRAYPRFWVLSHQGSKPELLAAITERCTPVREVADYPFRATLWEQCAP